MATMYNLNMVNNNNMKDLFNDRSNSKSSIQDMNNILNNLNLTEKDLEEEEIYTDDDRFEFEFEFDDKEQLNKE